MKEGNNMMQLTIWCSQRMMIHSQYGHIPWIAYLCNECERLKRHSRQAELRYNKQGQVALFVNDIKQQ